MKLIAFLLLLLTISSTNQACAQGCLKCDTSSNCIVADLSQGYVLSNNTAIKATVTNCLVLNADGTCASCNAGYYVDATAKCVAVPTASAIANCSYYSSATACRLCAAGFYLNNTACTAVTATIANCAAYASATTCSACNNNYILSLDLTSCVSVSSIQNCSAYSYVTCNSCASGYHLNRNTYLTSNLNTSTSANILALTLYANSVVGAQSTAGATVCATNANTNCTTFSVDTDVCTLCNAGYFLDTTGVCNLYPSEPILSCAVYTNATSCFSCVAGYTLNNNVCTAIPNGSLIANCATYNTSVASVTCLTCTSNFYLSSNACTARTNSLNISNCATVSNTADQCATCATGYTLSGNNLFCLANIANCSTYQIPTGNGTLQCTACASTFTVTAAANGGQNSCTAIAIQNCSVLNANDATKCGTCVNGYALTAAGACVQQAVQTNCSIYSQTAGACQTCNAANSFVTTLTNSCQTVTTPIPNCIAYSGTAASPTCTTCATNYYLTGNTCTLFTITGCVAGNNTTCTGCAAGSALNYNGSKCISPYTFIKDQCQSGSYSIANTDVAKSSVCTICNQNAFPVAYNGQFVCLSTAEAVDYNNNAALPDTYTASCLKVNSSMQCVQCDPTATNKFLQLPVGNNAPLCGPSCANGYAQYQLTSDNTQILNYNICLTTQQATVAGCGVYAPNLTSNSFALGCTQCGANYISVSTANNVAYSNADPNATPDTNTALLTNYIPSPYARFPIVTCTQNSTINGVAGVARATGNTAVPIQNCEIYLQASSPNSVDVSCLRCTVGNSGVNTGQYGVATCATVTGCGTGKYYNLDPAINLLTSCYFCTAASNIPVVAYTSSSSSSIAFASYNPYTWTVTNGSLATNGTSDNTVVCRNYATGPTGSSNWSITANCGIAAVIINNGGTNVTNTSVGNYCAACKPGFYNNAAASANKSACTAVANCATNGGTMFNGCSTCNANYILGYASSTIDFKTCLPITSALASNFSNCFAATADASGNAATCSVCKPGFNLNADSICETITPVNCVANGFRLGTSLTSTVLDWSLYTFGNANGCNRCNTGNIAVQIATARNICVTSNYITNTVDGLTNSNYVEHCKNYSAVSNAPLKCVTCQTNYVLNFTAAGAATNGTFCYINTNLPNCALAQSANQCYQCSTALFTLSSTFVCSAGAIANCAGYNYINDGTSLTSPLCKVCNPDYYRSTANNNCVLGNVRNCQQLYDDSPNDCQTCVTGYYYIDNAGNQNAAGATPADICLPNPTVTNCATTANGFTLNSNGLTCNACASPSTQVAAALPTGSVTTACLSFAPITNCATYSVATINTSDFTCTLCASGFYLANNRCVARTTIAKCTTYAPNADSCSVCDSTSFLSANAKACTVNPAGVYRCNTYSNATTCTSCKPGFYFANNTCTAVTNAIANCSTYSAATTCSACASGYALTNNTCVSATAQNCATYTSATACATCPQGYVLTTSNGVTSCTTLTKTGCATIDANPPNNCLSCNTSFYLSNGACVAATATIAQCTVYASATTCSQCNAGYVLSVDKTTCVNTAAILSYNDANCNNSQAAATPACSRCGAGRYFVNGACTGTCTITGCLACSPSNNAVCYICNTGYYQDSTGKCVAVSSGSTTPSSAGIFGVLSAFAVMIAVMIK